MEVPFVKFKRKRGAPLKYGPDKETSRKETARQRDATKVYLLSSHDEWRSAKQAYERRLRKPITNGEFALHLLSVHRRSKCSTCCPSEGRSEGDGEFPLGDRETQTLCECVCQCRVEESLGTEATPRKRLRKPKQTSKKLASVPQVKPTAGRARRRKQSSPQSLLREADFEADPEPTFPSTPSNGGTTTLDGKEFDRGPTMISTTTKLLQGLRDKRTESEEVVITAEAAEEEEEMKLLEEEDEGEDDIEEENAVGADSDTEYKPELEDESKSSEVPEDSDEDYGKPVRKRKPRAKLKKAPAPRPAPTVRVKRLPKKDKVPPIKRGPSMFIRRVSWNDLNKVYQCKICNFESEVPLQACRHLLAEHPEIVGALRDFLINTKSSKENEARSLYSLALEEPLPLPLNKPPEHGQDQSIARLSNSGEYAEKQMEARIQHFTDMLMPSYLAPTMPHLAGMPSFQQSFNRPPSLYDGAQNGMVPLPPHPLPPMTSATAIFGVPGIGVLPEGPMATPMSTASFVSGPNHQELHMTSPTTTNADMIGLVPTSHVGGSSNHGSQGGGPPVAQENGDNHQGGVIPPVSQSERIPSTDCFVEGSVPQTINPPSTHLSPQPQSELQSSSPVQPQSQGSSQPLPPAKSPTQPPVTYKEEDQPLISQTNEQDSQKKLEDENNDDNKSDKSAEHETQVDSSNPFENEDLLLLLERWVKIPLECPHCNMKLPYMKRKDKHRCKRPGPSVLCDICGKSYPQTYFRFHYRRVHVPQKKVPCRYCNKEFKPSSLSKHILERHKPTRPYKCGICGKEFNSKKHCDKHEAVHKTEKPHKCPTCNRGFTQRTNMKNHMRQHTGEQPYRCHNCMKSFTHNVSLKNHLKRYHGIDLWQLGHTGGGRPKKE
ncbi:Zinc finger protein Gfi-1b [Holothuria leucospilota]|uniref:Zinc finger protein Gfi-1b n=1 Tax=Holothuria leucospilota TaxID=206669 RepID=A0A9Q1BCK0_HOLLE|nr:Zinc finger protein Gfi-1b [Holothuria leucospilota]